MKNDKLYLNKGTLFTTCLLACIFLAYWRFISTYKAHMNAWPYSSSLKPYQYLNIATTTATLLNINKQQIRSLLRENS